LFVSLDSVILSERDGVARRQFRMCGRS
jgi:hypothetical protein